MKAARKIKLRGGRSIESKLSRLAYELEHDASRVRRDYPESESIANALKAISSTCGKLSRAIGGE